MLNRIIVLLVVVSGFALDANAAIFSYGNFLGQDYMYLDVTEDSRNQPQALFGAPSILGNTLDFDPLTFGANVSSVAGGSNSLIVDGQLNFTVMSNSDSTPISMVQFTESGDYTLAGLGNAQATAAVSAPVRWAITHVDGNPLSAPVSGSDNLNFTPTAGTYSLPNDLGTGVLWDGELLVDVAAFAAANGISGNCLLYTSDAADE